MSKILKIVGIIAAIAALGYLFFLFFVSPGVMNAKETVTASYLDNIKDATVCTDHFNDETVTHCEAFQTALEDETFTYELLASGDDIVATITIDGNEDTFIFSFISEPNTGISGFFHSTNYYIDIIQ